LRRDIIEPGVTHMEITEVRIKLIEEHSPSERLRAFCSITIDDAFVVRDLKIIEGTTGPFVAMPSRKLAAHCGNCKCKNHLRAAFCNQCGSRLRPDEKVIRDAEGRAKLYADIAHPINSACRELIQEHVIREFHLEQERSKQPDYVSKYDEYDREDIVIKVYAPQDGPPPRGVSTPPPVQATTSHPRGPHVPPAQQQQRTVNAPPAAEARPSTPHSNLAAQNKPDNFGAGIF
jgi:stage V sporulation protein G